MWWSAALSWAVMSADKMRCVPPAGKLGKVYNQHVALSDDSPLVFQDGESAIDHASQPWIRALLLGGARATIRTNLQKSRGQATQVRIDSLMQEINTLMYVCMLRRLEMCACVRTPSVKAC